MTDYDILIIGAGLSGINTAYRMQTQLPSASFALLEARAELGGTWAFWAFPGVRSDSSMGLFSLPWHPWIGDSTMADAHEIRAYLADAARAQGIDKKVRFRHRVASMKWSSGAARWALDVVVDGDKEGSGGRRETWTARWVIGCSGYYDYARPLDVDIPGLESFRGTVVHPQFWGAAPADVCSAKRVVIVGSGATAITMLPAIAKTATSVTMLQRSPSYVMTLPGVDGLGVKLRRWLPAAAAATVHWWWLMLEETFFVWLVTTFPGLGRRILTREAAAQLPPGYDVAKHFNPSYGPFEQRLCLCPDGDFFKALSGKAHARCEVVTDVIDTVTADGIRLRSGRDLDADVIVTATGLRMTILAGIPVSVDGEEISGTTGERYIWNGTLLEGVPNSASVTGYTQGTWTPGADVRAQIIIKVIKEAARRGADKTVPEIGAGGDRCVRSGMPRKPAVTNSSTYFVKARGWLPLVADQGPWRNPSKWVLDSWFLWLGSLGKGLRFERARGAEGRAKAD